MSAKKDYNKLTTKRSCYLTRAEDAARLTIPYIMPEGGDRNQELPTPYQSVGARGVSNMNARLLLTLFPPNSPLLRYKLDDFTLEQLTGSEEKRAIVEEGLNSMERAIADEIESTAARVPLNEALIHGIVTGNALLSINKKNGIRVFHLDQYVVVRDPQGEVLKIIVKEEISKEILQETFSDLSGIKAKKGKPFELYTVIKRTKKKWVVHQEVEETTIGESRGSFPLDKLPWIALRFIRIDGEDYGRGFVEQYIGDLRSLEGLAKAILEGSAASARALFMVNPNSSTRMRDISESENLAVIPGNAQDVTVLQMQKFNDFQVAANTFERTEGRVSAAFLLNSSIQRNAERVTAEEIRFMAQELETTLGGLYSLLSKELQLPLVKIFQSNLQKQNKLPTLPKGIAEPVIITGFEALGRSSDAQKLTQLIQTISGTLGPEATALYINAGDYIKRLGVGTGIDMDGLVRSDEDVKEDKDRAAQTQQMAELAGKLGPAAINQMGESSRAQPQQ